MTVIFGDKMAPFFEICSSFPTIIFSFLLLISLFYGLLTLFGLLDLDAIDIELPEADLDAEGVSSAGAFSGLLLKLGLKDVPFMIIFMLLSLFGWMFSFSLTYFIFPYIDGLVFGIVIGLIIFISSLFLGSILTSKAILPLKPFFQSLDQDVQKNIIGQTAIVRTGRVDKGFGEATVNDGGAGLILKVRAFNDEQFKRGDKVVLIEYDEEQGIYKVISETDFQG